MTVRLLLTARKFDVTTTFALRDVECLTLTPQKGDKFDIQLDTGDVTGSIDGVRWSFTPTGILRPIVYMHMFPETALSAKQVTELGLLGWRVDMSRADKEGGLRA